ncbi:hypothetical protein KJ765_03515 [Candidatus Micrarchaeota archaeon]|nr:hypothetical protein [Candidatus Micrarchaeota archaeon]
MIQSIIAAGFLEWIQYLWWLWLFIVAWFFYNWAREHLAFSPILTLAVAAILIFYLVIEHPIFGSMTLLGWTLLSSGILYLLPLFLPMFKKR